MKVEQGDCFGLLYQKNSQACKKLDTDCCLGHLAKIAQLSKIDSSAPSINKVPKAGKISVSNKWKIDNNHYSWNVCFKQNDVPSQVSNPFQNRLQQAPIISTPSENFTFVLSNSTASPRSVPQASDRTIDVGQLAKDLKRLVGKPEDSEGNINFSDIPGTFCGADESSIELGQIEELNPEELFSLATNSKSTSLMLQSYVSECSQDTLQGITAKLRLHYSDLLTHCYGNYLLQRIVLKHQQSFIEVAKAVTKRFSELINNEHSSRLIQVLIENSAEFLQFTLNYFKQNLKSSLGGNPASVLLVAAIKGSRSQNSIDFILTGLSQNQRLLSNKFFRKAVVAFIDVCSKSQLQKIGRVLDIPQKVPELLSHKWSAGLVYSMLLRDHLPTVTAFYRQLEMQPERLFEVPSFVQLFERLWNDKSSVVAINSANILTNLSLHQIEKLAKSRQVFYDYVLATISCCHGQKNYQQLQSFLSRHEVSRWLPNVTLPTQISVGISSFGCYPES